MLICLRRFVQLKSSQELIKPRVLLQNRYYGVAPPKKKSEAESPVYRKTDDDYKISKKLVVQALKRILDINTLEVINIISNNIYFKNVCPHTLQQNHTLYVGKGVTHETLLRYPQLLTLMDAEAKLKELVKLPHDVDSLVVLLLLSNENLIQLVYSELKAEKAQSKISLLSNLLKIGDQKACECIAFKPFLIHLPIDKLATNIKLLLNYGVTRDNICNDLWVLRYSDKLIIERLELAKKNDIEIIKTWMVRAQKKIFDIHVQRRSDNKSILGDNSLAEYLSERLECSEDFANYLILKQPSLKKRSLKKMKELIDFLYAQGFTSQHICRVPKVLVHSVDTIRKRLKELEEKNIQIDSLSILTKSQNQYMQCYEALVKSKNKSKSQT